MFNGVDYDHTSLVMQYRSVNLYTENKEVWIWRDNEASRTEDTWHMEF